MQYAAIPTEYNGVRFRSRLEARWAATFDLLNWQWEYEPFDLPGWIPDFSIEINRTRKPLLVDVKPIDGSRVPRDLQIKIEQATGAPLPTELRPAGAKPPVPGVWQEWEDGLPYTLCVIGKSPMTIPHNAGEWCGIGWVYQQGWLGGYRLREPGLNSAWREAGNIVQWRAPR